MQVPEGIEFNCGNCGWMMKVAAPPDIKKDYPTGRGYCTFNPPAVFPMPQQQGKLADIQGRQQVGFAPMMMRPVVEENEPPCGRYTPDSEMLKILKADQDDCRNCKEQGTCNCDTENEDGTK